MLNYNREPEFLTGLALLYYRHGVPDRALIYAIAAAKLDLWSPRLALLLGSVFLKLNQPEQAQAVLSRFDSPAKLLKSMPSNQEEICAAKLMARVCLRLGDKEGAYRLAARVQNYSQ